MKTTQQKKKHNFYTLSSKLMRYFQNLNLFYILTPPSLGFQPAFNYRQLSQWYLMDSLACRRQVITANRVNRAHNTTHHHHYYHFAFYYLLLTHRTGIVLAPYVWRYWNTFICQLPINNASYLDDWVGNCVSVSPCVFTVNKCNWKQLFVDDVARPRTKDKFITNWHCDKCKWHLLESSWRVQVCFKLTP